MNDLSPDSIISNITVLFRDLNPSMVTIINQRTESGYNHFLYVKIYMSLTLLNADGKFVAELNQEGKTLSELGVLDDWTVKVENKSGKFVDPLSGSVEHYKINEDVYGQREESFRQFKKRNIPSYIKVGYID